MAKKISISPLDYFVGGVSASAIFSMNIDAIRLLLNTRNKNRMYNSTKYELSLIGLVGYMEAFFKDHFASLINIYPQLLFNLKENHYDVNIVLCTLLELNLVTSNQFYGFVIAERYDFGTPNKINSLYMALLKNSPFSSDEKKHYEDLINDRNLIVHHNGIYTTKYKKQKILINEYPERVFMDSIVFSKKDIASKIDFCEDIVKKASRTTQDKLKKFMTMEKSKLNRNQKRAIEMLNMW